MINNISWQGYWMSIALLTGSYYLVILLLYYRNDFKYWLASSMVNVFHRLPLLKLTEKSLQIKLGCHSKMIMVQWWKRLCCVERMNGK
jgi:hypothetical protein